MNGILAPLTGAAPGLVPGTTPLAPGAQPQGGEGPAAPGEAARAGGFAALLNAVLRPFLAPAPTESPAGAAPGEGPGVEGEPDAAEGEAPPAGTLAAERAGQAVRGAALRDGTAGWMRPEGPPRAAVTAPEAPAAPAPEPGEPAAEVVEARPAGRTRRTGREAPAEGVAGTDPRHVHRDLALLHPELRARVERVVERMSREHGHEVRVTETFREQTRQDFLFAQGRTRPGPVVTWTRDSNHTGGRAVDVIVDGSYHDPAGYARLARIAGEEGLHTLGPRDPGHLELPGGGRSRAPAPFPGALLHDTPEGLPLPAVRPAVVHAPPAAPPPGVARVAEVARVATVARVAEVAQVGRAAVPGGGAPARRPSPVGSAEVVDPAPSRRAPESAAAPPLPTRPVVETPADPRRREGEERKAAAAPEVPEAVPLEAAAPPEHDRPALTPPSVAREPSGGPAERVAAPAGMDAASRVEAVLEARDPGPARPLARMTLRVENAEGGEDRIRVDLRGSSVDAAIETGTAATAERLNARLGELQQALERQGLEAESLRVRAPLEVEALRVAAPPRSHDPAPEREHPEGTPHERPRRDPDDSSRQRSRREQKEEEAP